MKDKINFGDLRRVTPISRAFGFERGRPVDRYYIESFLAENAAEIAGRVLEVGDDQYTQEFGGSRVTQADIIDLKADNPKATLIADLTQADHLGGNLFDCFIFTQTLQFLYDVRAAIGTAYRILKPGGVLLASFPVISQICRYDMDRWGDYWRFTNASVLRLLSEQFPQEQIQVRAHGNILTAICIMHGLAAEELTSEELDYHDPDYQIVITARAVKPVEAG
ncbi:MAG: methyltransferase domain-containing protein [Chloroflexota bacterium]|nr:MAG: methyltransferase domain-containing protein [Chloroflexota bacterium]